MAMGRKFLISLFIFLAISPIFLTTAMGVWLLVQTDDVCLNQSTGVGAVFVVCGLTLILIVCCGFCCRGDERMLVVGSCTAIGCLILMIVFGFIALIRSTTGFTSLKKEINSTENWMDIKHCLYQDQNLCAKFQHKYANDTAQIFNNRHFTHKESGCCKPPKECNFNFSSPTVWIKPENESYSNSDCYEWENDPKKLCYNCQACRLSFARDLKKPWTIAGAIVLIASLMLVSAFVFLAILDDTTV